MEKKSTLLPFINDQKTESLLGRTALHAAADHGKLKVIVYLIKLGAKQIRCVKYGFFPLHYAARSGRKKCIMKLTSLPKV